LVRRSFSKAKARGFPARAFARPLWFDKLTTLSEAEGLPKQSV